MALLRKGLVLPTKKTSSGLHLARDVQYASVNARYGGGLSEEYAIRGWVLSKYLISRVGSVQRISEQRGMGGCSPKNISVGGSLQRIYDERGLVLSLGGRGEGFY